VLPADILPTSATLNRVTYGFQPGVTLHPRDGGAIEEIPIERLADHVTKLTPEAEARSQRLDEAVIRFPVAICRNNVDIYDTPGLSDEARMTALTLGVLERVDAAILVLMADSPFSASEGAFLDSLLQRGLRKVLFVVTALDRIRRAEDRDRVLASIRERIQARIRAWAAATYNGGPEEAAFLAENGDPQVFGVSGWEALQARLSGDDERLAASGLPVLEAALERFLTEQADALALGRHLDRIRAWSTTLSADLQAREVALHERMKAIQQRNDVLDALLHAASDLAEDQLERIEQGIHAVLEDEPVRAFLGQAHPRGMHAALMAHIDKTPLETAHLAHLDTLVSRVSEGLDSCQKGVAQQDGTTLARLLAPRVRTLLTDLPDLAIACDRVVAHLAANLAGEDVPLPSPLTSTIGVADPGAPLFEQVPPVWGALLLPMPALAHALHTDALRQAATAPPNAGLFDRLVWESGAISNVRRALKNAVAAGLGAIGKQDPIPVRVQHAIEKELSAPRFQLTRFRVEVQRCRTGLVLSLQRADVLAEKEAQDHARRLARLAQIRAHAERVQRALVAVPTPSSGTGPP